MDGMVEENGAGGTGGSIDPLKSSPSSNPGPHVVAVTSIVHLSQTPSQMVQSVIQPNQQSVIQAPSMQVPKTNVILVGKQSSVIHTTQGTLQTLQIKPEPNSGSTPIKMDSMDSDDSMSDEENPKKRRDLLTRRPSYRKILNDLGGAEIAVSQGTPVLEDQSRKREMRLLKNREAARECRRKKKEYIKCLENRVAVLENQNKALIDELKTLKELYCKQKSE